MDAKIENLSVSELYVIGKKKYSDNETGFENWKGDLLTQITIPSSVTSIGFDAFKGCSSLMQIIIPSSLYYIYDLEISSNFKHPITARKVAIREFCFVFTI